MAVNLKHVHTILSDLINQDRYNHSIRVAQTAAKLAKHYKFNEDDAYCCGLIHDCAKELTISYDCYQFSPEDITLYQTFPSVWHAFVVEKVASYHFSELSLTVIAAAKWHTTGKEAMTLLEKIIFVADFIEPQRQYGDRDRIELVAFESIDQAVFEVALFKLNYLIKKNVNVYPKLLDCYNYYL